MSNDLAFSICSNSPSLISLTERATTSRSAIFSFSIESKSILESIKSPTRTAILFFHNAFTEKKPLRSFASSTTSS